MGKLWQGQLALAKKMAAFTGRAESTLLTRYIVPERADGASGIMRHYYGGSDSSGIEKKNNWRITGETLKREGANGSFLLGVMPQLQPLVDMGAEEPSPLPDSCHSCNRCMWVDMGDAEP